MNVPFTFCNKQPKHHSMGLTAALAAPGQFHDVFGTDPELLAFVQTPVLAVRARPPPAPQPHLLRCCGGGSRDSLRGEVILLFPVTPVSKQHKHLQVSCCCCC